jgi:hypothetical protein
MHRCLTAILLHIALAMPAMAQVTMRSLGAEGGDFRVELSDGRVLHGAGLTGATLTLMIEGHEQRLRIDAAEPDRGGLAPDVWLFTMTQVGSNGGRENYCLPDPQGHSLAIPYATPDGGLALTCSSGAIGKCFRSGYRPWAMAPDGRTSLAPYHAACVNLFRGAYGGPERSWTRDGMAIDVFDHIDIQQPGDDPRFAFEAGWTADGAVCVAHPRVPEKGSLADIAAAIPRLAGRIGPEQCTETSATALGALVFNRSRP